MAGPARLRAGSGEWHEPSRKRFPNGASDSLIAFQFFPEVPGDEPPNLEEPVPLSVVGPPAVPFGLPPLPFVVFIEFM